MAVPLRTSADASRQRPAPEELHEAIEARYTLAQIGELFGVSRSTVSAWKSSAWYRAHVDALAREAFLELKARTRDDLDLARKVLREVADDTRLDNAGKAVTAAGDRRGAATDLIRLHERLTPLTAATAGATEGDGAKALEAIRAAKDAADARVAAGRPLDAPTPVETGV
jgi:hypothetical protein